MADNENLRTASLYINNQLLSRGLLHDGQRIDFADPAGSREGLDATMGKIMSVVNDLILRRDRDAENRENLSTTLRNLRTESMRNADDITRLNEKHTEAQRKLNIAESSESSMRAQLKSAEAAVRGLKEEMARAKTLVAQTRATCATDVRRRDRQIDGLKKQLGDAGRARGSSRNPAVTVVNVVADVGTGDDSSRAGPSPARVAGATADPSYDLHSETNEFLTRLAKELSEENETLLALTRRTLGKLQEMSGWNKHGQHGDGHATTLQRNCVEMEQEMDSVLENLQNILTNPSFVPIEEVEVREDEINRLKDGWVKMEGRWQEAVHLIDGWRRRMASDGESVNMEELNLGLRLSPVRVRNVAETQNAPAPADFGLSRVDEEPEPEGGDGEEEEAVAEAAHSPCPAPGPSERRHIETVRPHNVQEAEDDDQSDSESSIFEDDLDGEEFKAPEPNVEILGQSEAELSSSPLPPPPQLSPLKDSASAGNRGTQQQGDAAQDRRAKPGDCTTIVEEDTWDLAEDDELSGKQPSYRMNLPRSPQKTARPSSPRLGEREPNRVAPTPAADTSLDDVLLVQDADEPPSPSPLPKERPGCGGAAAKDPPKPYLRRKEVEKPAPSAQRTATRSGERQQASKPESSSGDASNRTRNRDVSSESVDDNIPPQPAIPPQSQTGGDATSTPTATRNRSPDRITSRLPLPRPTNHQQQPQQSPLTMATIAAKLAASEREADAARVRAKLRAARGTGAGTTRQKRGNATPGRDATMAPPAARNGSQEQSAEEAIPGGAEHEKANVDVDPVKRSLPEPGQDEEPERGQRAEQDKGAAGDGQHEKELEQEKAQQIPLPKRKRDKRESKVASRRRSTLSPWEMESLISGSVAVPSPAK